MKKILAGLALSAALAVGAVSGTATPASAAGVYVNVGGGHHWHHHYWHRGYYHRHYWHHRHWR